MSSSPPPPSPPSQSWPSTPPTAQSVVTSAVPTPSLAAILSGVNDTPPTNVEVGTGLLSAVLLLLVVMWGIVFVRMVYSAGLTGVDQKDTETAITVSANSCIEPSSPPGAKGGKARRTFVKLQQRQCEGAAASLHTCRMGWSFLTRTLQLTICWRMTSNGHPLARLACCCCCSTWCFG